MKHDLTFEKPEVVEKLKAMAKKRLEESVEPNNPINKPKYQKIVEALSKQNNFLNLICAGDSNVPYFAKDCICTLPSSPLPFPVI